MISITLLALIALLLIMLLGRHGVAGTVDEGESKVQTNEINVATTCATICSSGNVTLIRVSARRK